MKIIPQSINLSIVYRAQGKRKHERSEYFLFLARYRQNQKCEARQARSDWILEGSSIIFEMNEKGGYFGHSFHYWSGNLVLV